MNRVKENLREGEDSYLARQKRGKTIMRENSSRGVKYYCEDRGVAALEEAVPVKTKKRKEHVEDDSVPEKKRRKQANPRPLSVMETTAPWARAGDAGVLSDEVMGYYKKKSGSRFQKFIDRGKKEREREQKVKRGDMIRYSGTKYSSWTDQQRKQHQSREPQTKAATMQ